MRPKIQKGRGMEKGKERCGGMGIGWGFQILDWSVAARDVQERRPGPDQAQRVGLFLPP